MFSIETILEIIQSIVQFIIIIVTHVCMFIYLEVLSKVC